MALVCAGMTVLFSVLSFRLVYVQMVQHKHYSEIAERAYVRQQKLPASRGVITDRNGELLARSQTVYTLYADAYHLRSHTTGIMGIAKAEGMGPRALRKKYSPEQVTEKYLQRLVSVMADPLGISRREMSQLLRSKEQGEVILLKGLEEDERQRIADVMTSERVGGIYFKTSSRRFYPSPHVLTHVIGYVNEKGDGKEGLEKAFDDQMKGEDGYRNIERDRRGREILAFRRETVEPRNGLDVELTIDMGLQTRLEQVVEEAWKLYTPEKMTAVIMDPFSGAVLAMASRPHFDLSTREGQRKNIAISDMYEPGSTFKMVALSAALEKRVVSPHTPIHCEWGSYNSGGLQVNDHHPYGTMSVEDSFMKSSNIAIYKIARMVGKKSFFEYMQKYGFGRKTEITLTGEISGRIFPPERWSRPSFASMSRGYEVGVTPIQMATALGVVANGGELMKPMLVRRIKDHNGRTVEEFKPQVLRRVISEKTAQQMRDAMVKVVSDKGTARRAKVEGYSVGGKTGTARKAAPGGKGYLPGQYVVSFMGFLPAENPQFTALVMVDDPHATGIKLYGGTIAAPIFAKLAKETVTYLNIPPTMTKTDLVSSDTKGE
ncbi:MAG: penicillin-binding protein 2 [Verrucomicrobiota bacterium]